MRILAALSLSVFLGASHASAASVRRGAPTGGKTARAPAAAATRRMPARPPEPPPKAETIETWLEVVVRDAPRRAAEQYLSALAEGGNRDGLKLVLGGAPLISHLHTLENWKIVSRGHRKLEKGELAVARALLADFDREARAAMRALSRPPSARPKPRESVPSSKDTPRPGTGAAAGGVRPVPGAPRATPRSAPTGSTPGGASPAADGDLAVQEVEQDEIDALFDPVREKARLLQETNPVFAFLAGADQPTLWKPTDPFRRLLNRCGRRGQYTAELDVFSIETTEGRYSQRTVRWPLYVVRFKTRRFDSGVRVLPTSDATGAAAGEVAR